MWMLVHRNAKTKLVAGGRSFLETCPECGRKARFDEVEITKSYGVFFIDLLDDTERKYRCSACHEVFDLRDEPAASPPAQTGAEREAERRAAGRQAEQAAQLREREQARAVRIEDELAELKKRMGR